MYGAILGDIIGSPYEFDKGDKTKDFPLFRHRSHFTDDSVMTIAVAEALLETLNETDDDKIKEALVNSMQKWGHKYPDSGYGGAFRQWLHDSDPQPYNSWGNGSAMRVSAAGWLYEDLFKTEHMAALTAEVTHNHPEGIKGAVVTAGCIFLALNGAPKEVIKTYAEERGYNLSRTCDEIRPTYHHVESCQETVPEAITAFLESTDFEACIRNAVSLGGDCDTLTCIAGSIAEAFYGVPRKLKDACETRIPEDMQEVLHTFNKHRIQVTVRDDWDTEKMPKEKGTITLHRKITTDDYRILRIGHIPLEMEDKWFWYMKGHKLYAHRSWTGFCAFILEINPDEDEHQATVNLNKDQIGIPIEVYEQTINDLLDYWTQPQYDYYSQWLNETLTAINQTNQGDADHTTTK